MTFEARLHKLLTARASAPFLFIGSGFSRRYLGLEDWDGLLSTFCRMGKPYSFYKSSANQDTPKAARLIAEDFHSYWWNSSSEESSRAKYLHQMTSTTSALRYAIADHLNEAKNRGIANPELACEIEVLKKCDVDGVITTNWDTFLEDIFQEYRVYVGQKELLFSNPMNVAEIYKIHGCCSDPESMVLTDDDYRNYVAKNAYLASKLITIFVEHPIVFIGYSIHDPNVRELLQSISKCVGPDNVEKLQNNLIFLDRHQPSTGPSVETSSLHFDGSYVPITIIRSADFCPVYSAIAGFQRKMPAKVLRFCKERIYEIVKNTEPDKSIAVIDFDSIDDPSKVEVVVGIGVLSSLGERGYASAIGAEDLFEDLIFDNKRFDARKVLEQTIPSLPTNTKFVPVFKYLRSAGINSFEEYRRSGLRLHKYVEREREDFANAVSSWTVAKYRSYSTRRILAEATESIIFGVLPRLDSVDAQALEQFLVDGFEDIMAGTYKYPYRRLMAFFDWLKYGWAATVPPAPNPQIEPAASIAG